MNPCFRGLDGYVRLAAIDTFYSFNVNLANLYFSSVYTSYIILIYIYSKKKKYQWITMFLSIKNWNDENIQGLI